MKKEVSPEEDFEIKKPRQEILLDPYTNKPHKVRAKSQTIKQKINQKKANLRILKSKTNKQLFQDLKITIHKKSDKPAEKKLKNLTRAMRNKYKVQKLNTDPSENHNRTDCNVPNDYKIPKMKMGKKNKKVKISRISNKNYLSNREHMNRRMVRLDHSVLEDEFMKSPLVLNCERKLLKHKKRQDLKGMSSDSKSKGFSIFNKTQGSKEFLEKFQNKNAQDWKGRARGGQSENQLFGKTTNDVFKASDAQEDRKTKSKRKHSRAKKSKKNSILVQLGLKKSENGKKTVLPKVKNNASIEYSKEGKGSNKKRGRKRSNRKLLTYKNNYRVKNYFNALDYKIDSAIYSRQNSKSSLLPSANSTLKVQKLKLKRDAYFLEELQKCCSSLKGFCQLTKHLGNFKSHFEETFKIFKMGNKLCPLSESELSSKTLPPSLIQRIQESSTRHQQRILVLDLDETLIHARYVLDTKDYTFKLFLNRDGPEVNVSIA